MKNILLKTIAFIFSVAIGFFVTDTVMKYMPNKQVENEGNITIDSIEPITPVIEQEASVATTIEVADTLTESSAVESTPEQVVLDLEFNIAKKTLNSNNFNFTANCNNLPEGVTVQNYNLYLKNDTVAPIKQATVDGIFKDVDYKSTDGTYLLCVVTTDNKLSNFKEISGFVKPIIEVKKVEKMSKDELQNLVNNISVEGEWYKQNRHPQISKNVVITVQDLINNIPPFQRKGFSALRRDIMTLKASATVKEVTYDQDNKINTVVVELNK